MISFIIPTYNAACNIEPLLHSVITQKRSCDEVIVVDDGSHDDTVERARKFAVDHVRVIVSKQNLGPAAARNIGAREARGQYLFFLDSDTRLEAGSVGALLNTLQAHPEIRCVSGITKGGLDRNPGAQYKAFVEYSWVAHLPPLYDRLSCFNSRVGIIDRAVFFKTEGFCESFKDADVEDYHFGYQVIQHTKIYHEPNVRVRHRFGTILHITKNYVRRSILWLKLFQARKKFDPGSGTSLGSASEYVFGFTTVASTLLYHAMPNGFLIAFVSWAMFLFRSRRLLRLSFKAGGGLTMFRMMLFHLYFSLVIVGSALLGVLLLMRQWFLDRRAPYVPRSAARLSTER